MAANFICGRCGGSTKGQDVIYEDRQTHRHLPDCIASLKGRLDRVTEILSLPVALMRAAGPPYKVTYSVAAFRQLADIIEGQPFVEVVK
jgi:hypothetical protein